MTRFAGVAAALSVVLLATPASAGPRVPANPAAKAKVKIVKTLTLKRDADLDFGTITMKGGANATATINATTGVMTTSNNLVPSGGTVSPAKFSGTAAPLSIIKITLPMSVTLTSPTTSDTLIVDTFKTNLGLLAPLNITVSLTGTYSFQVGGTLSVPSKTAPGNYSTDLPVTVEY